MTWTTVPTWTTGQVLTAAHLNLIGANLNETAAGKATTAAGYFVATGLNALAQRVPDSSFVTAAADTSSTSYTSTLSGSSNGPTVSVTTGTQALVIITAAIYNSSVNGRGYAGINVTGATTILASDDKALSIQSSTSNAVYQCSEVHWETGLTAGSNTFAMVYKVTSGTGTFDDRRLTIFPY